jgi:uncharacterized protein with ParB-like and HNH nuclease domain
MLKTEVAQKTFELGRMDIVDIYEWFESGKIITGPIFQRLSVWKDKDREDLIDTIMNGYPIPAIFICEGKTNFDSIGKKYVVLDGKQRLESISMFLKNLIKYNGVSFGELENEEKSKFLNFSLPVVQMYVNVDSELPKVQEIFKRLNKNSYNLNEIEKSLSQYIDYDFINICKILCSYIELTNNSDDFDKEDVNDVEDKDVEELVIKSDYNEFNFISNYLVEFFNDNDISFIKKVFSDLRFFTTHEQTRQKSIQHLINIFGTLFEKEHIGRNVNGKEYDKYSQEDFVRNEIFPIIGKLNSACAKFLEFYKPFDSKDLGKLKKFWFSKSNLYTLIIYFVKFEPEDIPLFRTKLIKFSLDNTESFEAYRFACQEAVNTKKNRSLREDILTTL